MRKRLLLSASILAGLVCVVLLVLAMLSPRPGVTKANFDRIENGMTPEEVVGILGPHVTEAANGETVALVKRSRTIGLAWAADDASWASIIFDDGHVPKNLA